MSTLNDHTQEDYKQIIIDSIKNGTRTARIAKELGLTKSYVDQVYFEYLRQPIDLAEVTEIMVKRTERITEKIDKLHLTTESDVVSS